MSSEEQQKKSKLVSDFLIAFGNISPAEAVLQLNGINRNVETPPPSPVEPNENVDGVNEAETATDTPAANEEIDEKTEATDDNSAHGKSDDETKSSATNSNSSPEPILCDSYDEFKVGASSTVVGLPQQDQSPGKNGLKTGSKRRLENSDSQAQSKKTRTENEKEKSQEIDCVSEPTTNALLLQTSDDLPRGVLTVQSIYVAQNSDSSTSTNPPCQSVSPKATTKKSFDSFRFREPEPVPIPNDESHTPNQGGCNSQNGKRGTRSQKSRQSGSSEKSANSGKSDKKQKCDDDGKVTRERCDDKMKNLKVPKNQKKSKSTAKNNQKKPRMPTSDHNGLGIQGASASTSTSAVNSNAMTSDLLSNDPTNGMVSSKTVDQKKFVCSSCGGEFANRKKLISHIKEHFKHKHFSDNEWIKRNNEDRLHDD